MTAAAFERLPHVGARRGSAAVVAGAGLSAAAAGYLVFRGPLLFALAFCVLPLGLWLFPRPRPLLILLGAAIPITYSLTGGSGGFNLAPSDLLLVFIGAGLLFQGVTTGALPGIGSLRALKVPLVQYSVFMLLLLIVHLAVGDVFKTGQRFELFLLPLVVGAFSAATERHLMVLKAYVLSATALAALWPLFNALGQKNPVGQMIANAILLLVGLKSLRAFARCGLVLVPGLLLTGSRGAVVATAIGILIMLALQSSRTRVIATRVAVVAVVALATFQLLPGALRTRLTTFSAGSSTPAAYSLFIRQQYTANAKQIAREHPWFGIGVGNYREPGSTPGGPPQDPHNVILLQAAEGGYAFAVSFVLLIGGVAFVLARMRDVELAPVAAGILLATVAHGLVDVYWVRATPVLGWVLAGMACASYAKLRSTQAEHGVS